MDPEVKKALDALADTFCDHYYWYGSPIWRWASEWRGKQGRPCQ